MQRHDIQTYQFCTFLRPDRQINHSVNDRPWMRQNGPKSCGIIHAKADSHKGIVTIHIYKYTYVMVHGIYLGVYFWYLKILKKLWKIWFFTPTALKNSKAPSYFQVFEAFTSPDPELGWPKLPRGRTTGPSPSDFVGRCVTSFSTRTVPAVFWGGYLRMMGRPPTDLGGNLLTNIGRSWRKADIQMLMSFLI